MSILDRLITGGRINITKNPPPKEDIIRWRTQLYTIKAACSAFMIMAVALALYGLFLKMRFYAPLLVDLGMKGVSLLPVSLFVAAVLPIVLIVARGVLLRWIEYQRDLLNPISAINIIEINDLSTNPKVVAYIEKVKKTGRPFILAELKSINRFVT